MPDATLRLAGAADVPLLEHWDEAPHVRAVSGDDGPWDWPSEIDVPWQEVWICAVDEHPIGVVILLDAAAEPTHYWTDASSGTFAIDIWIAEPDYLGKGFGTAMMHHAIARAFDVHHAHTIMIDPLITNTRAIAFYRSLGFIEVGPRRFGTDECLVLRLTRS